jgi:hypothetical protein
MYLCVCVCVCVYARARDGENEFGDFGGEFRREAHAEVVGWVAQGSEVGEEE